MANLLPILLLGGGALMLAKGKKKKRKKAAVSYADLPDMADPPKKGKSGIETWKRRQTKAKKLGFDPGVIDGKPGPDTRKAIMELQKATGITVDGKWGPQTAAAVAQALVMLAEGLGKAAYGQIGSMLSKFKSVFERFGRGREEVTDIGTIDVTGLPPTHEETQKDQLRALAAVHDNPSFDPDRRSVREVLLELQSIHGFEPTGRWDLATRILVNELLAA